MSSGNSFQDVVADVETTSAIVDTMAELEDGCHLISDFEELSGTIEADTGVIVPSGSETESDTFSGPIDNIIVLSDDETEQSLDSMDVPQHSTASIIRNLDYPNETSEREFRGRRGIEDPFNIIHS